MQKPKTIVIKYGGSILKNKVLKKQLIEDIIAIKKEGFCPIIVHGGGGEINASLQEKGIEAKFIDGLRVTDEYTIEIVEDVLTNKVNKEIVESISASGGYAKGLSGKTNNLILSKKKKKILGFVGKVDTVDPRIIKSIIKDGFIPIISPVAVDKKGKTYNINADEAAAAIAGAMKAQRLILLTDVDGVLKNENDPSSRIKKIKTSDIKELIKLNVIKKGMIPKLKSCVNALKNGVKEVDIVKGTQKHILLKVIKGKKTGTKIVM